MEYVIRKIHLIINTIDKIKLTCLKQNSVVNIVLFYRYSSLLIASILYYFSSPHQFILHRIVIITGMLLACGIFTYIYLDNRGKRQYILILTLVETFGNSFFIIVSGGFASPYIWYSISTLFITAVELYLQISIVQSVIYFCCASISTLSKISETMNGDIIRLYLNIAISYILIAFGLLQIIRYTAVNEEKTICLSNMNEELKEAKEKVEKTLKYCIEIYETVNIFNLDGSKNVIEELLTHMRNLSGVKECMFLRLNSQRAGQIENYTCYGLTELEQKQILSKAKKLIGKDTEKLAIKYCDFNTKRLVLKPISHGKTVYGAFIAITDEKYFLNIHSCLNSKKKELLEHYSVMPVFLKIAGIILKKMELDDLGEKLLISEEQNRIANEIHDVALQKLFAISCNLYVLSSKIQEEPNVALSNELLSIKHSVDNTMRDLRETIYGFSWEKEGEDTFKHKLISYTEEIKKLQGIEAVTEIIGDTQKIMTKQKNGLYRIICEALNNAVRHGNAMHIKVQIIIEDKKTTVTITDDGKGFDYQEYLNKADKGIGLGNIDRIVKLLNGSLEVKTQILGGTEIYLSIPSKK